MLATDKPQILVVEDNYLMAKTVCELVRDCGFGVAGAVGGVEAGRRFLDANRVDGAIVDINLDGTPSFEICDELSRREVPFFFLTGYERSIIPDVFRQTRLLTKPVEMREFRAALTTLAPNRPLAPERRPQDYSERGSRLLERLDAETWARLAPHLERVVVDAPAVLETHGQRAAFSYFPIDGLCTVFAHAHGRRIAVALIGNDSAVGLPAVLSGQPAAGETVVQMPMKAWRIRSETLTDLVGELPELRRIVLEYVTDLFRQIGETAVAVGHASVEQRVAWWLLTMVERTGVERIELTHEAMGQAFAVRRAGITIALHHLEAAGAIKSMRKLVRILDIEKLAAAAAPFQVSANRQPPGRREE